MKTELIYSYFPKTRKLARTVIDRITSPSFAPKIKQLEIDMFAKKKLPVQDCAGSFCINKDLVEGIKNIDIYALDIAVNKRLNKVKISGHRQFTRGINTVLENVPENINIFAPKQEYKGGLAKHVLSAFQELLLDPEYQNESIRNQNIMSHAVFDHDTGKAFDLGSNHPEYSARIISKRYKTLPLPKEDTDLIIKLIRHHHYSENIAKGKMTYLDYAKIFTEPEFKLLKIITNCDLKSKRGNIQYRFDENKIFFAEQAKVYKELREHQNVRKSGLSILA